MIDDRNYHRPVARRPEVPSRSIGRHAAVRRSHLPPSAVALSAAIGMFIVSAAYADGRLGHASSTWADRTYWFGQALIVIPATICLLSRQVLTAAETVTCVTVVTVAEYLVTVCYSPIAFTFSDELEHWSTTTHILQTGKINNLNYLLPISPHYPGLEEATSAFVSITGLSIFPSGLIIVGVAHLLFVYVLYVLFSKISSSYRIGGVAVLCYASNPHFASFDSMFLYQTLALPFLALTLLAAWHLGSKRENKGRAGWGAFAVLMIAATIVTHHVTSFVLVGILLVIALTGLLTRERPMSAWAGFLALLSAAMTVLWIRFVAPDTWGYLRPFVNETLQGVRALIVGEQTRAPPTAQVPIINKALAAVAVLAVSVLVPTGWWRVRRDYKRQTWPVAMAIVAVGWYVVVAVRFTVADGSELAGRAATFIYIPVAYMLALATAHLAGDIWPINLRGIKFAVPVLIPILIFNGLANGFPPYWERLPGPHQVAGFDRSVGPQEIAAARWALSALGPGNRFAADYGNTPIIGTYGDQNPLLNVGFLYTSPLYTASVAAEAQAQGIRYVLVDQRLSQSLPASGQYFPVDPNSGRYTHPVPRADLTKFEHSPGVACVYDDGDISIYRLEGDGEP